MQEDTMTLREFFTFLLKFLYKLYSSNLENFKIRFPKEKEEGEFTSFWFYKLAHCPKNNLNLRIKRCLSRGFKSK